jgi:hypothetical protein
VDFEVGKQLMEKAVRLKSSVEVWKAYINLCKRHNQPSGPIYKRATIYIKDNQVKNELAAEWLSCEGD